MSDEYKPCTCGFADRCDGSYAEFEPLQEGAWVSVRQCPENCHRRLARKVIAEHREVLQRLRDR